MTAVDPTTTPETRSRREVLCGLMVALVAPGALVAACGDTSPSGSSSGTTTGGATATTGGATSGGPAGSTAVAALADVPQGGGLVVKGTPKGTLLLVRPAADTVRAFDALCPHQGTELTPPVNGTITCPKHESKFDGASGELKQGPAATGLKEVPVKIEADKIVLA
ncbi:Rieske (2Fe-2S) protein [Actinokineospora sp. HUAS TT18]|uniref:Rieske (2Fe-2S) protein n=1 Tax=Actinokineospora sp. HUAS TT18 TaxID=3447451 RepID=UPI003F526B8A